jgi:hypothetical protein
MKKSKLQIDYDFDFVLIGITSGLKAFKLAWVLNRQLGLQLVKKDDLLVGFKGGIEKSFSMHAHQLQQRTYRLIKNRPSETDSGTYFLVPEHPHFDYLMVLHETEQTFAKNILDTIRKNSSVELAAFIPLASLKTKENFIF